MLNDRYKDNCHQCVPLQKDMRVVDRVCLQCPSTEPHFCHSQVTYRHIKTNATGHYFYPYMLLGIRKYIYAGVRKRLKSFRQLFVQVGFEWMTSQSVDAGPPLLCFIIFLSLFLSKVSPLHNLESLARIRQCPEKHTKFRARTYTYTKQSQKHEKLPLGLRAFRLPHQ